MDAATGKGSFAEALHQYLKNYTSITGIDIDKKSLDKARVKLKAPNIKFELNDAEAIKYDDEIFDTVCIADSLHHLRDVSKVLKEMKRVLKSGGTFIIEEFIDDELDKEQTIYMRFHNFLGEINNLFNTVHNPILTKKEIIDYVNNLNLQSFDIYMDIPTYNKQKAEEEKKLLSGKIDKKLKKIKDIKKYDTFRIKAEEIKEQINKIGIKRPPFIYIIGVK